MNWRLASRLSIILLSLLVVLAVALLGFRQISGASASNQGGTPASGLQGTNLGGIPAPNFHLTDQFGQPVSLSQFRGQPVVVTFMYTHCPTVCPLMAEKLHQTMLDLGSDARRVGVIAISVDPRRDTLAAALQFSQEHHMTSFWHFLVGTQAELSPIWSAYAIGAQAQTATSSMHTAVLYVLDKQGREQVFLDQDFTETQLATDLKRLLT